MEEMIRVYFVTDMDMFNNKYIENIEKLGKVVFCRKNNFSKMLIQDKSKKIIVYDPDFGGWNFDEDILKKSENILAVFLGTTDKSYINLKLCKEKNIEVFNIPKYAGDSVAEYLVMYMFSLAKKIPLQFKNENRQEFDDIFLQMQLKNKKVGIVGLGNIGSKIADICDGIGMKVCYWSRTIKQTNYEYVTLKKLFRTCDVIYLCLLINDETKKIVTDDLLKSMKKNAIFISCTGKQLFNYKIIEKRIQDEELFGYAIEEPDIVINKYKGNVMVTSEYGWFTKDAAEQRVKKWYENIIKYLCSMLGYSTRTFLTKASKKKSRNIICNIRRATKEDIPAIAKIYMEHNWFGEKNSIQKMKDNYDDTSKNNIILVAEYQNKVIGSVELHINKYLAFNCMNCITFDYLVVKREYRGKKVGTQLMQAIYKIAEHQNVESIWGVVSMGRKRAKDFFIDSGMDDPVEGFRKLFLDESVIL